MTVRVQEGLWPKLYVLSRSGRPMFTVSRFGLPADEHAEYLDLAERFVAMHDAIAEALDAPLRSPMPTLAELRPPEDNSWDCFAEDGPAEAARVPLLRRLDAFVDRVMERSVHGR